MVLSYYYDANRLEPELSYGEKLTGKIYIKKKELVKVELTHTKRLKFRTQKIEAGDIKTTSYFKRISNNGGHIEVSALDQFSYDQKGNKVQVEITSTTLEYKNENGIAMQWPEKPQDIVITNVKELDGSLGGLLPLTGKNAKKLRYKLPRPAGISIFSHHQWQVLEFSQLAVGGSESDLISLNNLFNLPGSKIDQNTSVTMVRGDVWLLPFLNVMGVVGYGSNNIDGSLFLDDELKDALSKLGFLIGLKPEDIPDYIPIKSSLTSLTYGAGVMLGGAVGNFNLSVTYQFAGARVLEANTNKFIQVVTPTIGYMTPFGMNIMIGGQGQFYNTATKGFLELPNNNELHYLVEFEPIQWNMLVGLYIPITHHFDLAVQSGWGDRTSVTAVLGYRF